MCIYFFIYLIADLEKHGMFYAHPYEPGEKPQSPFTLMDNLHVKTPTNPLDSFILDCKEPEEARQVVLDTLARAGFLAGMAKVGDGDDRSQLFENLLHMYEAVAKSKPV